MILGLALERTREETVSYETDRGRGRRGFLEESDSGRRSPRRSQ
jgi:hypothetical protein